MSKIRALFATLGAAALIALVPAPAQAAGNVVQWQNSCNSNTVQPTRVLYSSTWYYVPICGWKQGDTDVFRVNSGCVLTSSWGGKYYSGTYTFESGAKGIFNGTLRCG